MNTAAKNKVAKLLIVCLMCVALVYAVVQLAETV